jgi:hypothetical protein
MITASLSVLHFAAAYWFVDGLYASQVERALAHAVRWDFDAVLALKSGTEWLLITVQLAVSACIALGTFRKAGQRLKKPPANFRFDGSLGRARRVGGIIFLILEVYIAYWFISALFFATPETVLQYFQWASASPGPIGAKKSAGLIWISLVAVTGIMTILLFYGSLRLFFSSKGSV